LSVLVVKSRILEPIVQLSSKLEASSQNRLLGLLRARWLWLAAFILAELAFWRAASLIWISDDAYASFRYADNWARGLGLVFNAKERVEGITNPLWTLVLGVLARSGFDIENSSITLGLSAYVGCIPLLILACGSFTRYPSGARRGLPLAAMIAVADTDWATFASGGLETSVFSMSVLGSFVFAFLPGNLVVAGVTGGLCAAVSGMLRPDGALFVPALALAFLGSRRRGLFPYFLTCLPLLAGFHGWRRLYYGDWIPNTYYAKSAFLSWWTQGAVYLGYFSVRHAVVLGAAAIASMIALGKAIRKNRRSEEVLDGSVPRKDKNESLLRLIVAWSMTLVYAMSVARVGGDFMYARLLVPVIPLLAVATELSLSRVFQEKPILHAFVGVGVAGALFLAPCPVDTDITSHHGIVDERAYYQGGLSEAIERNARSLRECIGGFPVRAAIYGGELRLAYQARFRYAIEAHAGLTDPAIAHSVLKARQRVGHEKSADASYLVLTKKAHFATSPLYAILSDPNGFIPVVHADLCGVDVRLLHWDPVFNEAVQARGASIPDYPVWLDQVLARVDFMSDQWVKRQWEMAQHFYFANVSDPARERVFEARMHRSVSAP
jgi:hypothetical protein